MTSNAPPRPAHVEVQKVETLYRGYSRLSRYHLRHELYAGGLGPVVERELLERGSAVAVLLFDPAADALLMIEQFRPGAWRAQWEPWLLEIVAGIVEEGESPEDVCRRETREEAGVEALSLFPVQKWLSSPGITTETVELWCGRFDASTAGGLHGLAEEGEDIRVVALPAAEAWKRLASGELANATTLIALQWFFLNQETVRERLQS